MRKHQRLVLSSVLFVPQSDNGINAYRAVRGNVTRGYGDRYKQADDSQER
jgi:hypothetical protein